MGFLIRALFVVGVIYVLSPLRAELPDWLTHPSPEAAREVTGSPSARRIVDLINPITWIRELGQFKESATRVTEKALAKKVGRNWFRGQANPAHVDPVTGRALVQAGTYHLVPAAPATLWAQPAVPVDPSSVVVEQVWYPSKDGTRISMFLIHPAGLEKTGDTPTIVRRKKAPLEGLF